MVSEANVAFGLKAMKRVLLSRLLSISFGAAYYFKRAKRCTF